MVVLGQSGCLRGKMVVFGAKWLYFWHKWLYSGKVVLFGQK